MGILDRWRRLKERLPKPQSEYTQDGEARRKVKDLLDAGQRERAAYYADKLAEAYIDEEAVALLEALDTIGCFIGYELDEAQIKLLEGATPTLDEERRAALLKQWVAGWQLHLGDSFPHLSTSELVEIASHEAKDKLRAKLDDLAARKHDEDRALALEELLALGVEVDGMVNETWRDEQPTVAEKVVGGVKRAAKKVKRVLGSSEEAVAEAAPATETAASPVEWATEFDDAGDEWPTATGRSRKITIIGADSGWARAILDEDNGGE